MNDETQVSNVTDAEVAGLLAPEVASLSRELEAMRHTCEVQTTTIDKMQEGLRFADKENCKAANSLMICQNLMRAKERTINNLRAQLVNAHRSIQVANWKGSTAIGELETIKDYLVASMAGTPDGQDHARGTMTALDMLHTLMTSMELKASVNAKYDPELEIHNCRVAADAERESRMAELAGQAGCVNMAPTTDTANVTDTPER